MDAARMMREAMEQRARRGREVGKVDDVIAPFQPVGGQVPGGHLNNGRVKDISRMTITGLIPFGGTMDGMMT